MQLQTARLRTTASPRQPETPRHHRAGRRRHRLRRRGEVSAADAAAIRCHAFRATAGVSAPTIRAPNNRSAAPTCSPTYSSADSPTTTTHRERGRGRGREKRWTPPRGHSIDDMTSEKDAPDEDSLPWTGATESEWLEVRHIDPTPANCSAPSCNASTPTENYIGPRSAIPGLARDRDQSAADHPDRDRGAVPACSAPPAALPNSPTGRIHRQHAA